MKPLKPGQFHLLSPAVQRVIDRETREEIYYAGNAREPMNHSYQSIVRQGRSLSIATRVRSTVTPLYNEVRIVNDQFVLTGAQRSYTGEQIAQSYVNDASKFPETYYPYNGRITTDEMEQLILFTKPSPDDRYVPFARFIAGAPILCTSITVKEVEKHFSDPTVILNTTYQTLIPISCPELYNVDNQLPRDFLTLKSGRSIYESFKGGQAVIFCI